MNKLFNNTVVTAADYLVLILLSLVSTPILVNHLGIEGYGLFVFLSIFSVFNALSFFDLGMEGALMTYVAKWSAMSAYEQIQKALTVSVVYYGVIGLVLASVFAVSAPMLIDQFLKSSTHLARPLAVTAANCVAGTIVLQFLTVPLTAVLQGLQRFTTAKLINSVMNIIQYALLIAVVVTYGRIDLAFAALAGVAVLRLLTTAFVCGTAIPELSGLKLSVDWQLFRQLSSYSSVLFVSRLIGLVMNQIDKLLLWLFMPIAALAIYDIAYRPGNLIRMLTSFTYGAVIPEAARLHQIGAIDTIRSVYLSMIRYAYLMIAPLIVWIGVNAYDILYLWVGEELASHWRYVPLVLLVFLLNVIPSIASTVAVGLELVSRTIRISIAGVIATVVCSAMLIQPLGLTGLFLGTIVGQLVMVVPYFRLLNKQLVIDASAYQSLIAIAGLSIGAAAAHLAAQLLTPGASQIWVRFGVTLSIVALQYGAEGMVLLTKDERGFLLDKLRSFRFGRSPRAEVSA